VVTQESAIEAAGKVFASARAELDELFMQGGAAAVADAAFVRSGPSREELAALYLELRGKAKGLLLKLRLDNVVLRVVVGGHESGLGTFLAAVN
jgi:hypothetical protein